MPIGPRVVTGCGGADGDVDPGVEAKPILEVLDAAPFIPRAVVELCAWVA